MLRKVLLGLVIIGFLSWVAAMRRPNAPDLAADCTKAAFRLSSEKVETARPLTYTMVGAAGREYALGVNTVSFTGSPGAWRPVAAAGHENDVILAATPAPMPAGCKRTGLFALPVPPGKHTVTLYELVSGGAVFVAQQEIEVTEDE